MEKVNLETATKDVERWLDYKKVKPRRREQFQAFIDTLVDAVQVGQLVLEDDMTFKMNLDFPVAETSELKFKPRISDTQLSNYKRNIKGADAWDTQQLVLLCGLTDQSTAIIKGMDTSDRNTADAIIIFFQ